MELSPRFLHILKVHRILSKNFYISPQIVRCFPSASEAGPDPDPIQLLIHLLELVKSVHLIYQFFLLDFVRYSQLNKGSCILLDHLPYHPLDTLRRQIKHIKWYICLKEASDGSNRGQSEVLRKRRHN